MFDEILALQQEFGLKRTQAENTVKLIDEGNTIPFIARYRKEKTGSLDDRVLRELYDRLLYLRNLHEKCEQTKKLIDEQGALSDEIVIALENAKTLSELEDIYRPFRPKRRTRATVAKEKGLEPLASLIQLQLSDNVHKEAEKFVNAEKGVDTAEQAIEGAMDIIAEYISDNAEYRKIIRDLTINRGIIAVKAAKDDEKSVYEMYSDYREPVQKIAGHRVLAINRGEKEGFLSVTLEAPTEEIYKKLQTKIIVTKNDELKKLLTDVIDDSYKRLIAPSVEREVRNDLTEKAEESAIKVFGENLRQLLLQAPIKGKVVLALDPGYRNGCKVAVIDGFGKVLDTGIIYPVPPYNKVEAANKIITAMINKHNVDIIAIGNGTASRETEQFAVDLIKKLNKKIYYIIVNEAGASVYSASKLGSEEFPDFDVSLRSAVSIGRRLQDPLAELVKIDPKSIGVGQYQHDMNQKRLGETLGGVVEDCVNSVGIDLNTASPSLLCYISGISSAVAKNIVAYREENGPFTNRKQLLKVAKLGPKAFEQCAGFLRITDGTELLDNTGVHPESYPAAESLLEKIGCTKTDIGIKGLDLSGKIKDTKKLAEDIGIGEPTLIDIIKELEKPGRDPRDEMPAPILRNDVLGMEDLREGMIMKGTVRSILDFGAFVDIGVHQDGLVHISQMANRRIRHPLDVVHVGDVVEVKVLSVDVKKGRISLSMLTDR